MTDWSQIKRDYLYSNQSIRSLARDNGISEGTILSRAMKEGWTGEKEKYHADAMAQACPDELVSRINTLNKKDMQGAERLREAALSLLEEKATASSLKAIGGVLEQVQKICRVSLGIPIVPVRLSPEINKPLRECSMQELMDGLLSDPMLRLKMVQEGLSPSAMSDDEIIDWASGSG